MDWNVLRFLVHFFFTAAHFHLALVAASISHFATTATKLSCCSSNKKMSPLFLISRSRSLSLFITLSFAGLRPTFSLLCLSHALYSKYVDMTINLSLILKKIRIQKQFPLSVFVFTDSLIVSASQDAGGYAISRQNNLDLHLGCHTCWMSYFTLVCLWCGRTVGRSVGVRSRDYQILSDGWFTTFSYPWCSASRARAPISIFLKMWVKDHGDSSSQLLERRIWLVCIEALLLAVF